MSASSAALADPDINSPKGTVTVGKDVLDLLTGAMYVDPLTIFREYVQNAADAITLAESQGIHRDNDRPTVEIHFDDKSRTIKIKDNGVGVPAKDFWSRMTSIGASRKRGQKLRGFRGVGRLSGLGYAQEVVFRSKARGESTVSEIAWDGRKLKELLRDAHYEGDIQDAVRAVVTVTQARSEATQQGFFEVELRKVTRIKNDLLLNPEEVRRYLSQVAPVPFKSDFSFGKEIQTYLSQHGVDSGLTIVVSGSDEPITRPFSDAFEINERLKDEFKAIEFIKVPGNDGSVHAVGWVLHHSYLGAVPRRTGLSGLRVRAGNIQVGNPNILESAFLEPRFNSWCVGEIHVVTDRILPNGRRDDFEVNAHFQNFQSHAAALGARISRTCRERSVQRNRLRTATLLTIAAEEQLLVVRDPSSPSLIRNHYRSLIAKTIARLTRMAADPKFRPADQEEITKKANHLASALKAAPASRVSEKTLAFLPTKQRKIFVDTLKLAIAACDTPDHAARMARKVFERARRRKYSQP
jgi:hypothetical protein